MLPGPLRRRHKGAVAWGSSGPLREGKGSTYEGGLRVPCIVRWPGRTPAGKTNDAIFSTLDFMPTFAGLAGGKIPDDRIIDGVDQTDLLTGKKNVAKDNPAVVSKLMAHIKAFKMPDKIPSNRIAL